MGVPGCNSLYEACGSRRAFHTCKETSSLSAAQMAVSMKANSAQCRKLAMNSACGGMMQLNLIKTTGSQTSTYQHGEEPFQTPTPTAGERCPVCWHLQQDGQEVCWVGAMCCSRHGSGGKAPTPVRQ